MTMMMTMTTSASVGPSGRFLLLQVSLNPALRCTSTGTAENAVSMLETTYQPSQGFVKLFDTALRVAETDEGPNNLKCERLMMGASDDASGVAVMAQHVHGTSHTLCCSQDNGNGVC